MKTYAKSIVLLAITVATLASCTSKSPCDKFLDGYEKYVEQALDMANKMEKDPNDASVIADYTKMQTEALKWAQEPVNCKNDPEFVKKFAEIQLRLANKMYKLKQ